MTLKLRVLVLFILFACFGAIAMDNANIERAKSTTAERLAELGE